MNLRQKVALTSKLKRVRMNYMNNAESVNVSGIQELSLDELDLVAAGDFASDAAETAFAVGAFAAGVGVVTGQPQIVAAGAIIGGIGGAFWLYSNYSVH